MLMSTCLSYNHFTNGVMHGCLHEIHTMTATDTHINLYQVALNSHPVEEGLLVCWSCDVHHLVVGRVPLLLGTDLLQG